MRILFLVATFVCTSIMAMAQDRWFPGAIVKTNGDTINGLVSAKAIEFERCLFRVGDGLETEYTADQLKAFWIDTGYSFQTLELPANEPKFAMVLARGRADLLKCKSRFFLLDSLNALFELETIISKKFVEDQLMEVTQEKFKQTLMWKFSDCVKATRRIPGTTLVEPSLVKLFNTYNSCFGEQVRPETVSPRRNSTFYVGVDYGYLKTKLGDISEEWYTSIDKSQFLHSERSFTGLSFRYSAGHFKGVSFDIAIQKLEFKFASVKTTKDVTLAAPFDEVTYTTVSRYSTIRLPIGVSYSFFSWRKVQPFARLAFAAHLNRGSLNGARHRVLSNGDTEDETVFGVHPTNFSFIAEAGVNVKFGPVMVGVRGSLDRLNSSFFSLRQKYPFDIASPQTNLGVIASVGYVFEWN